VNGLRVSNNNFLLNGVDNNEFGLGGVVVLPPPDAIQEFRTEENSMSAEFGRGGAAVNVVLKSGTNQIHGGAYEFIRNDKLDAVNYFNQGKQPFKRNQFGFNIGGPVNLPHFGQGGPVFGYKGENKTFFYFSYEGTRQRQGLTISGVTVPTLAQRAAVSDSVIKQLLPLIPTPNVGTNGFAGSATAPVNIDQWTTDVSHNFSDKDRLHVYYAIQRDERGEPTLQGNSIPGFGDTRQSRRQIFPLKPLHGQKRSRRLSDAVGGCARRRGER